MSNRDPMTGRPGCPVDSAAYLLGALEAAEIRDFARHLERCAMCRDEVAALAPVLEALPAAAPPFRVRPALRRRVLRAARAEPKSSRWRRGAVLRRSAPAGWLALAAAVAAALVVALGAGHPRARVIPASLGRAELRVSGGHGELVAEHLAPLPAGLVYEVWLRTAGRPPAPRALFTVSARGRADVRVPGVLAGGTSLMVTVEPRGGSLVPTTRPVVVEPLT